MDVPFPCFLSVIEKRLVLQFFSMARKNADLQSGGPLCCRFYLVCVARTTKARTSFRGCLDLIDLDLDLITWTVQRVYNMSWTLQRKKKRPSN